MTQDTPNYSTLIESLAQEAYQGCGQFFEIYLERFQGSVDALLEQVPEKDKETVIALAMQHDYQRAHPN
ncbi:hypothetical protein V9N52_004134, partial [Vibrio navarrensis]